MVVGDEFQSPPFPTVHYTFDDTLEGLRCCAVNCLNQSVHTQSGCKKWVWAKPNLYPLMTRKQVVVTILVPTYQSQPCITLHYTCDERLDGLS